MKKTSSKDISSKATVAKATAAKASAGKPISSKTPASKAPATKAPVGKAPLAKSPISKPTVNKALASKAPPAKVPATKAATTNTPVAKSPATKAQVSNTTLKKDTVNKDTENKAPISNAPISKPVVKDEAPAAPAGPKARMLKPELKFFENLLNEKKETLLQELGYLEDNTMRLSSKEGAGDLSSHAYHLADHATETQDREQAFHMASREGKFLYYIEEALDRVRNGTFGVCKKCGKLIPKPRLEAVPTAKMCIDCKTAQERASEAVSAG